MTAQVAAGRPARPQISHGTKLYVYGVTALATVALGLSWSLAGFPDDIFALIVLVVLGSISWLLRESNVGGKIQFSFTSIILLASAAIVGPVGAGIVGAAATVIETKSDEPFIVRLFNVSMVSCVGSAGGLAYFLAGGSFDIGSLEGVGAILISVGLPLMIADIAECVTNATLVSGVTRMYAGVPFRAQLWNLLTTTGLAYIGYGIIGFLFVVLWIPAQIGWFSAILVLAPLLTARWAFVQYGEEQRAHERTLNALVTAVETKDPSSVGHSARVGQLCGWIADAMTLGYREAQDVRTAGMLHDLGRIAVPSRVLRSHRPLDDAELVIMAQHPTTAVRMLEGIDFLADALGGIALHHERYDGLGYPVGLAGEEIPIFARIIAVADAFDALTTDRPYRPALSNEAALATIETRAGGQFDPEVVGALQRAIARHGWTTTERTAEFFARAGSAIDHDDPEASDLLASRPELRARIRANSQPSELEPSRSRP
jgi:hypothetical protein